MKRMLLLLVSLLLISSVAMADHIGIYSDASGTSCSLAPGFSTTTTVIHKFSAGAVGARFKVAFPAGSLFIAFLPTNVVVPVGTLNSDISVGYGECRSGCIVVGTITAILAAGTAQVLPADGLPDILYANCVYDELTATGGRAAVGGICDDMGIDDCTVAVEPSTWGSVKSLYR